MTRDVRPMLLSVSIDLDPLRCYRTIYGLPPGGSRDPVTAVAARRFGSLLDELGIRGTLFVVGRELAEPEAARAVKDAHAAGLEIANHSHTHPYDLSRLDSAAIADEIGRGAGAIHDAIGERPAGFRAPGYLLGPRILDAAAEAGAVYDSSMLPSPAYQGVKAAALGVLRLRGRESGARLGDPRESLGPVRPYRPDPHRPWRRGSAPLVELPITSVLGLPLTGAVLNLVGPSRVAWLGAMTARLPFVNLELHGIDLMDITEDALDPDLGVQPDLRVPWERKAQAVAAFVRRLLQTHRAVTLREAASRFSDD